VPFPIVEERLALAPFDIQKLCRHSPGQVSQRCVHSTREQLESALAAMQKAAAARVGMWRNWQTRMT
jgi:uncharacterized protein YfcZ (UPF0381/DUF406 family)